MRGHLVRAMVRLHVPKQTLKSRLHSPLAPSSSLFLSLLSACFNSRHFLSVLMFLLLFLLLLLPSWSLSVGNSATASAAAFTSADVVVALFPDYFCNCCLSCCGYISRICLHIPSKLMFSGWA